MLSVAIGFTSMLASFVCLVLAASAYGKTGKLFFALITALAIVGAVWGYHFASTAFLDLVELGDK